MLGIELGFFERIVLGDMLSTIDGEDEVCALGLLEGSKLWIILGFIECEPLGKVLSTKDG